MTALRRAGLVLLAWAALLALLLVAQLPFGPRWIEFTMLATAAGACLVTGLVLWWVDGRRPGERPRALADDSLATATFAVGCALALLGAGFGLWLTLIGAGVAALGLGGIAREQLARRREGLR